MQSVHQKMMDGSLRANISQIISNIPTAAGLDYARKNNIPHTVVDHRDFDKRSEFDSALISAIEKNGQPDLVLLAGFMRLLTTTFTARFANRLINIHPSLLPRHPGLDTHSRALQSGDRWHGCSVHFVNETLDGGPLIARGIVPVLSGDTEPVLAARVLDMEHRVLPSVVGLYLHGDLACRNSHVKINDTTLRHPLLYYYNQ